MATKAERYRSRVERSGPKKAKAPPKRRRDEPVDTARPGVSATDRRAGAGDSGKRNVSKRAARKGGAELEGSRGRPSRKSTRRAKGRVKRESNLARRTKRRQRSPQARAASKK